MIQIRQETLIPLREAPRHLPCRPSGKRVHISACYRWVSTGVRGVRLDSLKLGGTTYTSLEALQRFANALTGQSRVDGAAGHEARPSRARTETALARRLEHELNLAPGRLSGAHREQRERGRE